MRILSTFSLALLLLAGGCGMKGGLYMPTPEAEPQTVNQTP